MATAERALLHRGGRRGTWGSLGLWADGDDDYAGACEALARAVGRAGGIEPGDHVLSLACGAGDELLLWARGFGAAQVLGIERDGALVHAATRLAAAQAGHGGVIRVQRAAVAELPSQGLPLQGFDRVLCVDAAYHLRPREGFLRTAWSLLRPGGRLAYTDLSVDDGRAAWLAPLLRGAARLCGLAADELLPASAQVQRLQALGFVDVQFQRLDEAVLDGFARFVRGQGPRVARTAWHPDWRRPALTARLIGPCRAAGLGYGLLSATRGNDGDSTATGPCSRRLEP